MGTRVRAAFFVTVEAEVDDYGKFVSPHSPAPSVEQAQSWLSQNYFDRIDSGIEVGDRPESLTWTVDTVVEPILDEVETLVSKHWALSDHIYGDDNFREFVRQQEREEALREIGRIGQEQARVDQLVEDWSKGKYARQQEQDAIDHARKVRAARLRAEARGYRDFL